MFITKEKYDEMNSEIKRLYREQQRLTCDNDYYSTFAHRLQETLMKGDKEKAELIEQVRKLKEENAVLSALLKLTTKEN